MKLWSSHGLMLIAICLSVGGCKTTPAGDGIAQFNSVILPHFPIGQPGTFEFKVRHTRPVYPHWMYFKTRSSSSFYPYTPFDEAVFRVEMVGLDGNVLSSRIIRPRAPRIVDEDEYRVVLWNKRSVSARTEFRVRVEVLRPSKRPYDKARIHLGTP
tara:strand:+ start:3134 stop:3601 length:468 start_codon:yes stop_codon:yes gene_type:complete